MNQLECFVVIGLTFCGLSVGSTSPARSALIPVQSYTYGPGNASEGTIPSLSPSFPDTTGGANTELTNGISSPPINFSHAQWVGFQDPAADAGVAHPLITFNLGVPYALSSVNVAYLHSNGVAVPQAGGTITAPESVFVSTSLDGITYSSPINFSSEFNIAAGNEIRFANLDLTGLTGRYVQMDFRNTSPCTFLAEVSLNGELAPVPEPSTLLLAAVGGIALLAARWRRRAAVRSY